MAAVQTISRPMEEITVLELPPELQAKLKAPLPPEAITPHPSKSYLSSIKPAFVIERMNDAFGIGAYRETYREISVSSREEQRQNSRKATVFSATVHGSLSIPKYGIHLENFGGSENEDAGDALKGACTDAFTKMCSHLGVGLDVYKGKGHQPQQKPPQRAQQPAQPARPQPAANTADKITISGVVSEAKLDDKKTLWLKVGTRVCATKLPEIITRLNGVTGKPVELLVSELSSEKNGTIHQIHKVVAIGQGGAR